MIERGKILEREGGWTALCGVRGCDRLLSSRTRAGLELVLPAEWRIAPNGLWVCRNSHEAQTGMMVSELVDELLVTFYDEPGPMTPEQLGAAIAEADAEESARDGQPPIEAKDLDLVVKAIDELSAKGFLEIRADGALTLTEKGRRIAARMKAEKN